MSTKGSIEADPQALMAIRNLELRARGVVEGYLRGLHKSPYHGFSVEFTEYRVYSPGDDPRYLDWKLYGRSDRYYIKKYEDETNLRAYFLLDNSRSMGFGSAGYTKSDYAKTLAATLSHLLFLQGDAVGWVGFDRGVTGYLPARNRPGHKRRLMHALDEAATGEATHINAALARVSELVKKHGLMVLLSDLLTPLEGLREHLAGLNARGHELIVFQVLDAQELAFDFEESARFYDLESGQELFINPASSREAYQSRLEQHLTSVEAICAEVGASFCRVTTTDPLRGVLQGFLQRRSRHTVGSRRRAGRGRY